MDLVLQRHQFLPTGIFGSLVSSYDGTIAVTLEHAFEKNSIYLPALPVGSYLCVRGQHQLSNTKEPFETFEVTHVSGRTGILFHAGNYNRDSHGCILVGLARIDDSLGNGQMIQGSRRAFAALMELQQYVDSFQLEVREDQRLSSG